MKILIAGGTGFIGSSLIPALLAQGNSITVISRQPTKIIQLYQNRVSGLSWQQLENYVPDDFDVVINLAGENIADKRWSPQRKSKLKESRISTTDTLVKWLCQAKNKQKMHLYNASAVGIYGAHLPENANSLRYTESTALPPKPADFCSELVSQWEAATLTATRANIPVTLLRFGVVLKRHQGILKKLELPFFLGLGSMIGSGEQSISWIHIDDLVNAILFLVKNPEITGPVNICSPQCVTQRTFANTMAKVMHRPLLVTFPAIMVKLLFGQMGQELLLSGQNVFPEVLKKYHFKFTYPDLDSALFHEWEETQKNTR